MTTLFSSFRCPFDRSFARRAATRMAASVAVMSALSAVSHDEPQDGAPFQPLTLSTPEPSPGDALRQAVLSERSNAKTDRLHQVTHPPEPVVVPAKAVTKEAEGVILFDQCRPFCESRDPLLPDRRVAEAEASPEPLLFHDVSFEPEPQAAEPVVQPDGIFGTVESAVSVAARSGRAIAGNAARLLPW